MHDDGVTAVELSSLLVVEACARRAVLGQETHVRDVAALADVAPSTASRLVDAAERAGLLRRRPSSESARQTALVLTSPGQSLQRRAESARRGWLADVVAEWPVADVDRLGELLQRFAADVGRRPRG